jgi:pimeloyl-ACP methyl ester carboxylesterase
VEKAKLPNCELSYEIWGKGGHMLVIQAGICSCAAEWRHIAEDLGKHFSVLIYDRAGYGESNPSSAPRTPENISGELRLLLEHLGVGKPVTLLGHSQGGLYGADFALRNPEAVRALVLLDPLTPYNDEFKDGLSKREYADSGIDKLPMLKMGRFICGIGLGGLMKPLLRKSPPFYYHDYPDREREEILNSLTRKNTYDTAIQEYLLALRPENHKLVETGIRRGLLSIPLAVLVHSSDIFIGEMVRFAHLERDAASRIEAKWQELMRRYTGLSREARLVEATSSGHYIHLTDYPLLREILINL